MIFPDVNIEEWLRRYPDLKIFKRSCPHCNLDVETNQVFISKDYIGIQLELCPHCGQKVGCSVAIPRTKEKLEQWRDTF